MKKKLQPIWAVIAKEDITEYKKGELVEVNLFKKNLKRFWNKKFYNLVNIANEIKKEYKACEKIRCQCDENYFIENGYGTIHKSI